LGMIKAGLPALIMITPWSPMNAEAITIWRLG
jgi:hypothetical protein